MLIQTLAHIHVYTSRQTEIDKNTHTPWANTQTHMQYSGNAILHNLVKKEAHTNRLQLQK